MWCMVARALARLAEGHWESPQQLVEGGAMFCREVVVQCHRRDGNRFERYDVFHLVSGGTVSAAKMDALHIV